MKERVMKKQLARPGLISAGARFGVSLINLGRLDADEYEDFAVGAPNEDDGNGAVYIYHGSRYFWKQTGKVYRKRIHHLRSNLSVKLLKCFRFFKDIYLLLYLICYLNLEADKSKYKIKRANAFNPYLQILQRK